MKEKRACSAISDLYISVEVNEPESMRRYGGCVIISTMNYKSTICCNRVVTDNCRWVGCPQDSGLRSEFGALVRIRGRRRSTV